ncbi:MAG: hypothetical protein ACK5LP_07660 [Campylobacteraceae bacterium]
MLEDEYENFIAMLFFKSLEIFDFGYRVNFDIVSAYCKKVDVDIVEAFDVLSAMCIEINRVK